MPKSKAISQQESDEDEDEKNESVDLDPIIDGLLERMPPPGDVWSKDDRALWFEVLEKACQLIYPEEEEGGSAESP